MSTSFDELLEASRGDDARALGQLLDSYAKYLEKIVASARIYDELRRVASMSDLVQHTYLKAVRDFHQFRGNTENEFRAWLRKILINTHGHLVEKYLDAEKRNVRREFSMADIARAIERSAVCMEQVAIDRGSSPSGAAQRRERSLILSDELAKLPEDYRQVIELRNIEGLSFEQVATRMGRKSGAVRMLWLRAIKRLRLTLNLGESV